MTERKKRINAFTWKIKWIVVYFLVIFSLVDDFCFHRNARAAFLRAHDGGKFNLDVRKEISYLFCSVFNWKPSWCCFNLSLLSIGPRRSAPRELPRCCARKYLLSSALSIKRGRSRRKADKLRKVRDLFYRAASGGPKSMPPPRINCLNDFQLFNSHFFWVITRFGCFCRLSAFRLPAFAKLCPAGDGQSCSATNDLPATFTFPSLSSRWPEAFEDESAENFQFDTNWPASFKPRLVVEGFRPPNRARLQRFCFCVLLLRAALEVF